MPRPKVVLELASYANFARDLAAGGLFIPGCKLGFDQECDLVVRGTKGELTVVARIVMPGGHGAGVEIIDIDTVRARLVRIADSPVARSAPAPAPASAPASEFPGTNRFASAAKQGWKSPHAEGIPWDE